MLQKLKMEYLWVYKRVNNLIILLFCQKTGCSMFLKLHFLQSDLDVYLKNFGTVNNKHGEHFHHEISAMENR